MSQANKTPKPRKLKVYQAQIGFYDTVVAAPNKAAALRAWGIHRNLFSDGEARETADPQATAAALAAPGTPLRRGVGTADPFGLKPNLPTIADLPRDPPRAQRPKTEAATPTKPKRQAKPPPDRSALTTAEAALEKLERDRRAEEASFRERRAALEAEEAVANRRHAAALSAARAALREARQDYEAAAHRGG